MQRERERRDRFRPPGHGRPATASPAAASPAAAGTVWAWGVGSYGELGNGSTPLDMLTAVQVDFPAGVTITALVPRPEKIPLSGVTVGTGARTHSLFVSNGTLYACGSGEFGELGNESTKSSPAPTPVVGLPGGRSSR